MKALMPHPQMLRTSECAAILGMSSHTLANWRVSRFGPPWSRLGGSVRYDTAKLQRWVEAQESRPRAAKPAPERVIPGSRARVPKNHRLGGHITQQDRRDEAQGLAALAPTPPEAPGATK